MMVLPLITAGAKREANASRDFIMTELQVLSDIVNNLGMIVGCSLAPAVKCDVDATLLTGMFLMCLMQS